MKKVETLVRAARWSDALDLLDEMEIPPECVLRHAQRQHNRGVVLLKLGRNDDAANAFQQAYSYDSSDIEACVVIGRLAVEGGDFCKGLQWLRRAEAAEPGRKDVRSLIQIAEAKCNDGN